MKNEKQNDIFKTSLTDETFPTSSMIYYYYFFQFENKVFSMGPFFIMHSWSLLT